RRRKPTARGDFALHLADDGFTSIRHQPSGEIMHSVNDPDLEAERVYVAQSAHLEHALGGAARQLVVWDVGLGAAHNAMALIRAVESAPAAAHILLISFERDLDALRLALTRTDQFPHVRHAAPHLLAAEGNYRRAALTWTLCPGDFRETFGSQPRPDVVFYDPFSTRVDGPMWTLALFGRLFAYLDGPTELFTYSSSTAVRSSLLAAGFHVARGVASGPKQETTIALTRPDAADFSRHTLLGREWLARRARSTARYPADVAKPEEIDRLIAAHPQFYCP
ncbi:MAG TPA: MnmC family methyltransferase, partial [Kofleriaceae bacterium]|nr:MnmC family methyltransferase [Kofleriaceae bacterium]